MPRPDPRLPRGFADRGAEDMAETRAMLDTIGEVFRMHGFEAIETPMVEDAEALGKFLPDQDRPNEGVFSWPDDDERWLALRYDLTAPLARHVAANFERLPKPYRSHRAGWVFRNEKPGPGRYRQFMQCDADIVGTASVAADAEMAMLMCDVLEAVGLERGDYVVKVSNRKLLDGVMEAVGLGGEENAGRRLTVLRAIDKLDRLGMAGVAALLGPGRKDTSGDFTKGANLSEIDIDRIFSLIYKPKHISFADNTKLLNDTDVPYYKEGSLPPSGLEHELTVDAIRHVFSLDPHSENIDEGDEIFSEGAREIKELSLILRASSYESDRILIDPSVVRGLEYYTGPVYEAELLFPVMNDAGETVRFGSVGGGGRYDGLVSRFRPESVPATGFSIGVSRLLAALRAKRGGVVSAATPGPVVILALDRDAATLARLHGFARAIRGAGIPAEVYAGTAGMRAQMKYADRRGAPCAVIQGETERAMGQVQVKDLAAGSEAAASIASNEEYRTARLAQVSVPEAGLVDAVRAVLARRG